ncbi:hypothetical protein SUGI_0573920 [Cryptomeria japonica]|nr:hypothetical protein SUGI_0573920 [Cryptomeria japonica]
MGNKSSRIPDVSKEVHILMVGLDSAGKTTILYKLNLDEVVQTIPTVGFNVETVKHKNVTFVVCDVGSQENIRPLWKEYIGHSKCVIFVVDSDDRERISEAKDVLHNLLKEKELRDAAVVVFANKNDFPNAKSVLEITEELEMSSLTQRHWHVQSSCATSGDGLYEGLDWLSNNV